MKLLELFDMGAVDTVLSICDKYISLYQRDIYDDSVFSNSHYGESLINLMSDKLVEIINRRAMRELAPFFHCKEMDNTFFELVSANHFSDFVEKQKVLDGVVSYCNYPVIEAGDDYYFFDNQQNPLGFCLSAYAPSFLVQEGVYAYQDMFDFEGVGWRDIFNFNKEELFLKAFSFSSEIAIEDVPSNLLETFQADCTYSEEAVFYVVRQSSMIPAFELWDNHHEAKDDLNYRLRARMLVKDFKECPRAYENSSYGTDFYAFSSGGKYYDVFRQYSDAYSQSVCDDRLLYPDVFYKNLEIEVLLTYLNNKYHFMDIKR